MSTSQIDAILHRLDDLEFNVSSLLNTTLENEILMNETQASLVDARSAINEMWLLLCAFIVFFMQAGFSLLEAGAIPARNLQNILIKNILDACVGGVCFFVFGYTVAYGSDPATKNGFIGTGDIFIVLHDTSAYSSWLFQWAFAATAATIVSGAMAERCRFSAYLVYTMFISTLVYPVVAHWIWSTDGWLSAFNPERPDSIKANGVLDFAGSGVVHLVGGTAAFWGTFLLGPRVGRFDSDKQWRAHNSTLTALGTLVLWLGWYGFNCGSTLAITGGLGVVAAKVSVTTTLGACAGGVTVLALGALMEDGKILLGSLNNGILAGLVSVTAGCAVIEPWAAVVIGFIGGFIYTGLSTLLVKLKIDDPVDAVPVHFGCGAWGLFAVGLWATEDNLRNAYAVAEPTDWGGFYGGGGMQLGNQVLAIAVIFGWVTATVGILFLILKVLGLLRIDKDIEVKGMDHNKHGGPGYTFDEHGVELESVSTNN